MASQGDAVAGRTYTVRRRPTLVEVAFARADGACDTLEGRQPYAAGDALVTGVAGERYPVARASFDRFYTPCMGTEAGGDGRYRRREMRAKAWRARNAQDVTLNARGDVVQARAGDWIVAHGDGDQGVVQPDVFDRTYVVEVDGRHRLLRALGALYEGYVRGMRALAPRPRPVQARPQVADAGAVEMPEPDDDERARLLGNAYRGIGVVTGLCGLALVLASTTLEFTALGWSYGLHAKVAGTGLLLGLAGLLAMVRIKQRWIALRLRVERARYARLKALADDADGDTAALDAQIEAILGVPALAADTLDDALLLGNQVAYNLRRQQTFETILRGAKLFTRGMLALSVLAAAGSLLWSSRALATVAVAAPGLAGVLQGINGFLRLRERATEHAALAARLDKLNVAYRAEAAPERKRWIARQMLDALTADHEHWQRATEKGHGLL